MSEPPKKVRVILGGEYRRGEVVTYASAEALAEVSNQWVAGKDRDRWSEAELIHTVKGAYIINFHYHSLWQGEEGATETRLYPSLHETLTDIHIEMEAGR